jgi:hypothetical protein
MRYSTFRLTTAGLFSIALLAGCGGTRELSQEEQYAESRGYTSQRESADSTGTTIWEAFFSGGSQETRTNVNKYLWSASLEVLDFLPVESVDPFTGVITTGYGTPPGSGKAYRATILIDDPALDARSLNVSLQTRNGPASASAVRAVENAILSRARQLRIADDKL